MDGALIMVQVLNGLQLGVLLFLLAAGLTLVFGIMDFINLAHGAFYMLGAFVFYYYVFCGGEIFKKKLFFQIKKNFSKSKIFNMYGPTECTMNCLSIELSKIIFLQAGTHLFY